MIVREPRRRREVVGSFREANARALASYEGENALAYASLKLAGLAEAPEHLAVFVDRTTRIGEGLGRATMPETLSYSVVAAVCTLWLAARAEGIGVGWVSILDPLDVRLALDAPPEWDLIAYLCIGYPDEEHVSPELEREGWAKRLDPASLVLHR